MNKFFSYKDGCIYFITGYAHEAHVACVEGANESLMDKLIDNANHNLKNKKYTSIDIGPCFSCGSKEIYWQKQNKAVSRTFYNQQIESILVDEKNQIECLKCGTKVIKYCSLKEAIDFWNSLSK